MIKFPHFAVPNLFLVNGYEERTTHGEVERSYSEPEKLDLCVARVLLRKPQGLRGWDFRFLRRELELSQKDVGKLFQRDAQTIARWEKTKRRVPKFADFLIRCRFAARFDPSQSLREVLAYVDGIAPKLPDRILLVFRAGDWYFQFEPIVAITLVGASVETSIHLPALPGPMEPVHALQASATAHQQGFFARKIHRGAVARNLVLLQAKEAEYITVGPTSHLHFSATGATNERLETEQ